MAEDEKNRSIKFTIKGTMIHETKTGNGYMVSFLDHNSASNFASIRVQNIPENALKDASGNDREYVDVTLKAKQKYEWNYTVKDKNGQPEKDKNGKNIYGKKILTGEEIEKIYKENMKDFKFVKESGGSTYFKYKSDIQNEQKEKDSSKQSDIAQKARNQQQKQNEKRTDADRSYAEEQTDSAESTKETGKVPDSFENMLRQSQEYQNNIIQTLGEEPPYDGPNP